MTKKQRQKKAERVAKKYLEKIKNRPALSKCKFIEFNDNENLQVLTDLYTGFALREPLDLPQHEDSYTNYPRMNRIIRKPYGVDPVTITVKEVKECIEEQKSINKELHKRLPAIFKLGNNWGNAKYLLTIFEILQTDELKFYIPEYKKNLEYWNWFTENEIGMAVLAPFHHQVEI